MDALRTLQPPDCVLQLKAGSLRAWEGIRVYGAGRQVPRGCATRAG